MIRAILVVFPRKSTLHRCSEIQIRPSTKGRARKGLYAVDEGQIKVENEKEKGKTRIIGASTLQRS